TAKKAVSINFAGSGKRNVRVGYVVENPIWKTSYRLVLDKDKKAPPYLQGWAVVENPTDEDWKDVRMALVSGRPISFQMDLYTPLYVPRPVVEPELFASLRPVAYSGGLATKSTALALAAPAADAPDAEALDELGGARPQDKALRARGPGQNRAEAKKAVAWNEAQKERFDLRNGAQSV